MEIQDLKYFLEIVAYKHFTVAASELCISQSSLSKHIKSLEDELGVKLFDRSTRNVTLTDAGKDFYDFAAQMIASYHQVMEKMEEHKKRNRNTLTIGTIPVMSQYGISALIANFMQKHQELEIQIIEDRSPAVMEMLDDLKIDLAFIRTVSLPNHKEYKVKPLIDDELVMIVPKKHPLAGKSRIVLSRAARENFILLDSGPGVHDICLEACRTAGFEPRVIQEYTRIETIIGAVAEGAGVSLLMKRVVDFFHNPDIEVLPLESRYSTTLALVEPVQKKATEAVKSFHAFAEKWFEEHQNSGG